MMYFSPDVYGDMEWPSTLRRDVRQIYQSSRQLLELVDDVLDLARIDASGMPVRRERSDLGEVLREAVNTIGDLLRGRDLELHLQIPDNLPMLSIDRTRIRQVLLNLLNNAARFTEQGSITVSAEMGEGEIVVSVRDTGIGMAPHELVRVPTSSTRWICHCADTARARDWGSPSASACRAARGAHLGREHPRRGEHLPLLPPLPGREPSVGRLVAPSAHLDSRRRRRAALHRRRRSRLPSVASSTATFLNTTCYRPTRWKKAAPWYTSGTPSARGERPT